MIDVVMSITSTHIPHSIDLCVRSFSLTYFASLLWRNKQKIRALHIYIYIYILRKQRAFSCVGLSWLRKGSGDSMMCADRDVIWASNRRSIIQIRCIPRKIYFCTRALGRNTQTQQDKSSTTHFKSYCYSN